MRPRFFYGYVFIALCFANMVVMRGVNGAFGVYFLALLEEFPWSRSAGASIASANFFVYAIASPLVGLAFDRYGPRVLMPLGAFLTRLGLVLSSFAHLLGGLYFTYGIVTALGQGALSFVGLITACSSQLLIGTKRIVGRDAASQIAAASVMSFLPPLPSIRYGLTKLAAINRASNPIARSLRAK